MPALLLLLLLLLPLLLAVPLWGCGGEGDGEGQGQGQGGGPDAGGGGDAYPAVDPFDLRGYCVAVADAACALERRCDSGLLFARPADPDRCLAAAHVRCMREAAPAKGAADAGAVGYCAAAVTACFAALAELSCADAVQAWGLYRCLEQLSDPAACSRWLLRDSSLAPCRAIFQGRLGDGEACYHSLECRAGSHCARGVACPGTCEPLRGEASSCSPGGQQCAAGLDCTGSPARCVPWAGEGELCTTRGEGAPYPRCRPPLTCLITSHQSYGTCHPRKDENQGCGDEEGRCQPDLHCRRKTVGAAEGWCNRQLPAGAACDVALSEPPGPCALGLTCFGPAVKEGRPYSGGTCQPLPGLGEPCTRYVDGCLEGFCAFVGDRERTGFCQALKGPGEGCSFDAECASGVCLTVCTEHDPGGCTR